MSTWIAVGVAAVIVVALRAAFVVPNERFRVPAWFDRAGTYVAPAMTAAMLAPRALDTANGVAPNPETLAFLLALPVALRTRSVGATLALGMPLVWIARALL